ncbi:fatty acid desaturase [Legionella sp. km772]|uniref:fatty acid desaturase n=1 Tax=Legionella sp. km772 TaxID=2498111 RepID=UPI000F8DE4EB|nr:fatty acid desaturase [Legionella sp. km772]RUR05423.1 fatty acid desaturase [Legionella sp. km772]
MNITMRKHLWREVKLIKSSEARTAIPEACYKRSFAKNFFWYFGDLFLFLFGLTLIFSSVSLKFKVMGSLISGLSTAMLFVWAHDAAHGALFKNNKVAEVLGTIAMFPSLNVYRLWSFGHNKVHHGFASFSPIDWIWRPLTAQEYYSLSKIQQILYRVERCFFTSAFHYLRRIWWEQMLRFNPGKNNKEKRYYRQGKIFPLLYVLLLSIIAYFYADGMMGILLVVILPFIIFNYFIAIIVYLHHTHPSMPFFDLKSEWSHSISALFCSTIIHCSHFTRLLLHNIMIHIPHHLDPRIPFYNLPQAHSALKEKYGAYFHEYRFKLRDVLSIFKQCKLYDFDNKLWMTFRDAGENSKVV